MTLNVAKHIYPVHVKPFFGAALVLAPGLGPDFVFSVKSESFSPNIFWHQKPTLQYRISWSSSAKIL